MSPRKRLSRYFELVHRQSQLTASEFTEMCNLEISLIDDIDEFERLLKEKDDQLKNLE